MPKLLAPSVRHWLLAAVVSGGLLGCDAVLPLNDRPPSYIKQVTAYKEGSDGVLVYVVLADQSGQMTTSDGELELTISETQSKYSTHSGLTERQLELYSTKHTVSKADFQRATVGMGAFEHDVILVTPGRIPYSRFRQSPTESFGKVNVTFTPKVGSSPIKGEEAVVF